MPPITVQQPAEYDIREKTRVPNGAAPVYEDPAAPFIYASKSTAHPDYDEYTRLLKNSSAIRNLIGAATAGVPQTQPFPQIPGAVIARFPAANGIPMFVSGAFTKANTGMLVTHLGGEHFLLYPDPAWKAGFDLGTPIQASFTPEAVMALATERKVEWTPVVINTFGTRVSSLPAAPTVAVNPAPRNFAQGVAENFSLDLNQVFSAPAGVQSFAATNSDDTALTFFTLTGIAAGVASFVSPGAGFGPKDVKLKVTDIHGRPTSLIWLLNVVENPEIKVISTPPPVTAVRQSTFSLALAKATLFDNFGEPYSVALLNADGSAPPAGYSYDGVTLDGPTEPAEVTRSFIIRATETGPLARSKDTASFPAARLDALPIIVDILSELTIPENATTRLVIDVRGILNTDAGETVQLADGSALPGPRYVVTPDAPAAGQVTVDILAGNNEIFTQGVRIYGTTGGVPTFDNFNFRSIHNPPVDGVPSVINALADAPVVVNVAALSDDEQVNFIVAGSAFSETGQAQISADRKSLTVTSPGALTNDVDYGYVLEAGAGGPQTAVTGVRKIAFKAVRGPVALSPNVLTQSTEGVAFPSFDATAYWRDGSYPRDPASLEFYDATTGDPIGKTQQGPYGTFSISSLGVVSYDDAAGFVGPVALALGMNDIKSNPGDLVAWTHTQIANPGSPPPPDPNAARPNTLDGKPVTQRGMESPIWWSGLAPAFKNQRMMCPLRAASAGAQEPFVTSLIVGGVETGKGTHQRITDGEFDPSTGWHFVPEGASTPIMHPRWWQGSGHAEHRQGDWSIQIDVRAGDNAVFSGGTGKPGFTPSWAESGSQAGIAGGVTRLINNSAPFNYDRRRFVRTLTTADTGQTVYYVIGGVGGCWIRYWFGGEQEFEADWQADPIHPGWKPDAAEEKEARLMDPWWTNDSRAAKADDLIDDGYYFFTGNAGSWSAPLTVNNDLRKSGSNLKIWAAALKALGMAMHLCVPMTLGAHVTASLPNGFYSSAARSGIASAGYNSYRDEMFAVWPSVLAAAKTEFRTQFQRYVQNLIDAGWLDSDMLTLEPSNEIWNSSFVQQNRYAWVLEYWLKNRTSGQQLAGSIGNSTRGGAGAGFIANLMATEFAQVVSEMKPNQQWQLTVGLHTNTAASEFTAQLIKGWNLFIADNPARSLPISFLGGAPTDYLSDVYKWTGPKSAGVGNNMFNAATEAEFDAAFIATYLNAGGGAAGALALRQLGRDFMLNPASGGSTVFAIINRHLAHKATLEAAGAKFRRPYEGSDHNQIDGTQTLPAAFDAATGQTNGVVNLMLGWNGSAEAEEVFRRYFAEKAARGLEGVTNYYKISSIKNWGGGGPWFEKHISEIGVAPTIGVAKVFYDLSRVGQGATAPVDRVDEDFEANDTLAKLTPLGWTAAASYSVVVDPVTLKKSLYSANEFDIASKPLRSAAQANATIEFRGKLRPEAGRSAELARLEQSATGDAIVMTMAAGGELAVSFLGKSAPIAMTTAGLNLLDGAAHDLRIIYYAATVGGLIEVRNAVTAALLGSFGPGNTLTHFSSASPNVDSLKLRGKVYWDEVEDVTDIPAPPVTNQWETTFTVTDAAGVPANFPLRLPLAVLPGGAAHEMFLRMQTDAGDLRAFKADKVTEIPLAIVAANKANGSGDLRVLTPVALAQGETVKVRAGGDGAQLKRASTDPNGSQAVWPASFGYNMSATDLSKNWTDDEIFTLNPAPPAAGPAVRAGPNTLATRGFKSQGSGGAAEAVVTSITTNPAVIFHGFLLKWSLAGYFPRICHQSTGDDIQLNHSTGKLKIERTFDNGAGNFNARWSVDYPLSMIGQDHAVAWWHDGNPATLARCWIDGVEEVVTVEAAAAGSFVAGGTTQLILGNHNGFTRVLDGQLAEMIRIYGTPSDAWIVAWQKQILAPLVSADAGAAW